MVSSGDVPSDFQFSEFLSKPDFGVFQHNRANLAVKRLLMD
jgi:hypothetical protein